MRNADVEFGRSGALRLGATYLDAAGVRSGACRRSRVYMRAGKRAAGGPLSGQASIPFKYLRYISRGI
jgi:hypothetical protein